MIILKFDSKYKDLIINKKKTSTVRLSNKGLNKGDIVNIKFGNRINSKYQLKITEVSQKTVNDMNYIDLMNEGNYIKVDLIRDLQKYYPLDPINEYTKLWIIKFKLINKEK